MRAPVASLPFGRRNTTRRLSFPYRVLDRGPGRWLFARTPALCAQALACKARTAAHYPLPFTVGDVGIADCATTRSLTGLHSWPAEAEPVRKPATSAHRLCRYPRRLPGEDERAGPAWTNRTRKSGETPWGAPLSRRCRRLSGARPPFPPSAEAEGACPSRRSRKDEIRLARQGLNLQPPA